MSTTRRISASGAPQSAWGRLVWGEVWRLLVAAAGGALMFANSYHEIDVGARIARSPLLVPLDVALGIVALGVLLLRRRAPLTIALVLIGSTFVASAPTGAAMIATASLATRRDPRQLLVVVVPFVASTLVYDLLYPSATAGWPDGVGGPAVPTWSVSLVLSVVVFAMVAGTGAYVGTRRDLVRSLREQAQANALAQARAEEQARATERVRIAREMHDVLAHRMSLVAMHAGALAYRIDLSPDQVRETAATIRTSTQQALEELRGVLGVLRSPETTAHGAVQGESSEYLHIAPARPQPTLDDLDELVDEARAAGNPVRLIVELDGGELPAATSRNAYRLLQEALTNARKHAPGGRVVVEVRGRPGAGLTIRTANPMSASIPRTTGRAVSGLPGAGLGLAGMAERAQVSGGTLTCGKANEDFEVCAWLPWPT